MRRAVCLFIIGIFFIPMLVGTPDERGINRIVPDNNFTFTDWKQKLRGPLRMAVEIYKKHQKLTEENVATYMQQHLLKERENFKTTPPQNIQLLKEKDFKPLPKPSPPPGTKKFQKYGVEKNRPELILVDVLIDPLVQKRWNNPPYDVLRCNIEIWQSPDVLKNYNLKIRAVSEIGLKKIVAVEIASQEIENVAKLSSVQQISAVLKKALNNDQGTIRTRADRIRWHEGNRFTLGYTGEGVIVGIIDTGIDWSHEDFIDPVTGESRVLYLWDTGFTTPGSTPADIFGGPLSGLNYGTVWTKAQIDAGTCTSVDTNGHGTHVAGSAAGNGLATGNYAGMAPNADIVFVQGLDNNGILFIYEVASQLNRPCSVNMSYGPAFPLWYVVYWTDDFPADGTSTDAQMIMGWNNTYGPGHIPVKSAGNEGHWNTYNDLSGGGFPKMTGGYHASAQLTSSSTHTMQVPNYQLIWASYGWPLTDWFFPYIMLGFWYKSPCQVTFTSPNGNTIGPMAHGSSGVAPTTGDGWCLYYMNLPPAANGHYFGWIDFMWNVDPVTEPTPGQWQVLVEPIGSGSGYFDMWVYDFIWVGGLAWLWYPGHIKYVGGDNHSNYIIDEGASPYEICVGSWNTKDFWNALDGGTYTWVTEPWVEDISEYSSPGPARNRMIKPDIAAPGNIIMSSASQYVGYPPSWLDMDGRHTPKSGTSMSAPHVTGGVALMLQKYPNLNVAGVRNRVSMFAHRDFHTRWHGSNAFGHGKFNVLWLNDPPVAIIQTDRPEVILDDIYSDGPLIIDGGKSYDPEGFPMSYSFNVIPEHLNNTTQSTTNTTAVNYTLTVIGAKATLEPDPDVEAKYTIRMTVNDTICDTVEEREIIAQFYPVYPPSSVQLQRLENNLIFQKEYVNRLTWSANSTNKAEIKVYRVYRKSKGTDDTTYQLIEEVDGNKYQYDDRGLTANDLFTYRVTTVSNRDKESDPAVVSN